MDFLRRLFFSSSTPKLPARSVPALPDSPEWFEEDESLPYPQWEQIGYWIAGHIGAEDFSEGYNHAVRLWLTKLAAAAGPGLTLSESTHFILLSPFESDGRKWTLKTLENARRTIFDSLGTLAWSDGWGKQVVLIMDHAPYNLYISHYFPGDYMGRSAGVMITGGGFAHIAAQAPPKQNYSDIPLLRTLAHELTHNALCQLQLPRWLDEALAMSFEDKLAGSEVSISDRLGASLDGIGTRALLQEFAAWWTEERLQGFWSGTLWNSEDDEQAFSYEMSRVLFRILSQTTHNAPERLRRFVRDAQFEDGGEAAAQDHLGLSLGEVAAEFLGEGDWEPRSSCW